MKRLSILMCLLFVCGGLFFAQEAEAANGETTQVQQEAEETAPDATESPETPANPEDAEPAESPDTEDSEAETAPIPEDNYVEDAEFVYKMNQKGDQFIKIGLAVNIPLKPAVGQLKVGGSGSLGYMRFLNSNIAVGGDASFSYMTTIGDNIFTTIPLMAKVMYQFAVHKFEIPITLGIGGAFENYNSDMQFGLIVKPEVGVYFRYSPSWSFGLNAGWNLMPQWAKEEPRFYLGVIMDAGITARYHF